MSNPLVVLITASESEAADLAEALVERRLVACVNIVPNVESVFRWDGGVEREPEALLVCKTSPEAYDALESELPSLHSYDVPECIAIETDRALAAYAQWVSAEARPDDR